jgi:uncharacterized cofD-like protein
VSAGNGTTVRAARAVPRRRGERPAVAVVGGGTGSFNLLTGLRRHALRLRSIVTMMDSGGDSGELRDAFGVLPPGDLRRCLVALSEESRILRDLFSFRFDQEPLRGRNFGNLFILALTRALGSEEKAVAAIARILKIRGEVLPVTWDHVHLHAELEDGTVVRGEANIDRRGPLAAARRTRKPLPAIRRVFLEPAASANPSALAAIASSDAVVLAPGDLFTSTVPNLLVKGVRAALRRCPGPLVYVANLMTKYGETDGWTASRHVGEIVRYGGRVPDAVLVHRGPVPEGLRRRYEAERASRVESDADRLRELGVGVVREANVMAAASVLRHDPTRTATVLVRLLRELWAGARAATPARA